MKKSTLFFLIAAFAVGLLGAILFLQSPEKDQPAPVQAPQAQESPAAEKPVAQVVRQPVAPPPVAPPASEEETELPSLEKSDGALQQELTAVLPQQQLVEMFIFDHLIRRFVLMVDSLPRSDMSYYRLPLYSPFDRFIPREQNGILTISPENYQRYTPFINLVEKADMNAASKLYFRYYPLFQEAYRELGYPEGNFNARFIEVIDHLLATPIVKEPIRLLQPHIRYQYADPELEALSAGQKLLIRVGSKNSEIIRAKLRELKPLLVTWQANP